MEITKNDILRKTNYGLNIYAHILSELNPSGPILHLSGRECAPVKNPFTNNPEATLFIRNIDDVFLFTDKVSPFFEGDPFDFSELYFRISGEELHQKLNDCLSLNLDNKFGFYGNRPVIKCIQSTEQQKPRINIPVCSYFKKPISNTAPAGDELLTNLYLLIKGETFKAITAHLRSITDKAEARKFKSQNFDYVTFSGTFSKRSDDSLIKHSNLLTIDFDHISDIDRLKSDLIEDRYFSTELLFRSPSGDGLKWIIPCNLTAYSHALFFEAVKKYIWFSYHLQIDKSGCDVSRACFLPYDGDVYLNPKYHSYVQ